MRELTPEAWGWILSCGLCTLLALLGIAGATLAPSTLALISNMFRDPRQRSLAIGVWMISFIGGWHGMTSTAPEGGPSGA